MNEIYLLFVGAYYKGISKVQQTDNTLTVDNMNKIYLLFVSAY